MEPTVPDVTLANPRADRVKQVRALSGRSSRLRHSRFLVEGPQGVREAVRFAPGSLRDVYLTPTTAARYAEIADDAREAGLYVHIGTDEVLSAMSPDCQGVLAVADLPSIPQKEVESAGATGAPRLLAILSNVRDPGNAGAAIRCTDAAGADAVLFAGDCVDVYSPKVVRATAGSLFHLPIETGQTLAEAVESARESGCRVLAADGCGTTDLFTLQNSGALAAPSAWIFGNEAWGLTEAERALADDVVRVPILGRAESLNLATAAAVCLYASAAAQARPV